MHLFSNYIHPLTLWLHAHPQSALLITFVISLTESLAIIGSIIPGSITMTAIGILAGSGVMRIDLTFLAATLGAIAGDSASYVLGYVLRDRLTYIWPFNRYPHWLKYGKDYFEHHGTTSIFLGRFFGPMRSIMPLIAGMMRMNQWHFLIANITSAIGWAALYVAPGVLIGVASSELSTESTTRFFAIILALLIVIWMSSLGAKWLIICFNQMVRTKLHNLWMWLKQQPRIAHCATFLAPDPEINHFPTAALTLLLMLCFIISIVGLYFVFNGDGVYYIDVPINIFLQSLRSPFLDSFFIVSTLLISPIPLATLTLSFIVYLIYYHDWRALRYWLCLNMISIALLVLLMSLLSIPSPDYLLHHPTPPSFLDSNVTLATCWIGFLFFYLGAYYHTIIIRSLQIILLGILILASFGTIYLGDAWFTNVITSYVVGLTICLLHWVFYRRRSARHPRAQISVLLIILSFLLASTISSKLYYKSLIIDHSQSHTQHVITELEWWNQTKQLLPRFTTNRFGKKNSLLNIQYAGSIINLSQALETEGWEKRSNSYFYSLILRAAGKKTIENTPLTAMFYHSKKPDLIMTYHSKKQNTLLVLQLWRSNYHLSRNERPIIIGSVVSRALNKKAQRKPLQPITNLSYIKKSLPRFNFKQVVLTKNNLSPLPNPAINIILLIKEPPADKIIER